MTVLEMTANRGLSTPLGSHGRRNQVVHLNLCTVGASWALTRRPSNGEN